MFVVDICWPIGVLSGDDSGWGDATDMLRAGIGFGRLVIRRSC